MGGAVAEHQKGRAGVTTAFSSLLKLSNKNIPDPIRKDQHRDIAAPLQTKCYFFQKSSIWQRDIVAYISGNEDGWFQKRPIICNVWHERNCLPLSPDEIVNPILGM
jgi:hypothetical protein